MAVLAGVPHASVHIRVAGEIATEYEAPSDQASVVRDGSEVPGDVTHCYIEAKSGAEFSIETTVNSSFPFPQGSNAFSMDVAIDGVWVNAKFFEADWFSPQYTTITLKATRTLCYADQEGGEPCFKNFVFSPVVTSETTSSGDMASEIESLKDLGVIEVVLTAVVTGGDCTLSPTDGFRSPEREVPEKALKGRELSHRVTLGTNIKPSEPSDREAIDTETVEELGTIFFHYRSREALQREMIIPRSPSPETRALAASSPVGVDLSNLSGDEIRRLAGERLRDLQVKNESGRIKREAESVPQVVRPLKVVRLSDGTEAFDLTEDD